MRLDPQNWIDHHLHYGGEYEPVEGAVFCNLVRPGHVVVDVGANIGYYTLAAWRLVGEGGRVLAFEPTPATFRRLRENTDLNAARNVETYNLALGDEEGGAEFFSIQATRAATHSGRATEGRAPPGSVSSRSTPFSQTSGSTRCTS